MKKILLIGWKDVRLSFRDRAALILMLMAPFALTLGLGFVTGSFSGPGGTGLSHIPVVLVNQDGGELGDALVALLQSSELGSLLALSLLDDAQAARRQVDEDRVAAAIIVPLGFTAGMIPPAGATAPDEPVQIVLYTNPSRPTSAGVVQAIVDEFVNRVQVGRIAAQVAVTQLLREGLVQPQEAARIGAEVGARLAGAERGSAPFRIRSTTGSGEQVQFNALAYMAPGMALLFLMFTVTNGGRTLLAERAQGTLPRLLVSPTSSLQVLGGKVLGIYLTGVAQMLILIGSSTLLFRLNWGDALGVLALVLAAVVGAVGWGMLITALVRTPGQISAIGSAVMLTFGILGGTFMNPDGMPSWFRALSTITPNAWGLDGFTTLALGGRLPQILGPMAALLLMGAVLFAVAAVLLQRRGIAQG